MSLSKDYSNVIHRNNYTFYYKKEVLIIGKRAIYLINFIKENKLEDVRFPRGYDDSICISFEVELDENRNIDYEFYHQTDEPSRIRLFVYSGDDFGEDLEVKDITQEEALKLRGLA